MVAFFFNITPISEELSLWIISGIRLEAVCFEKFFDFLKGIEK